MYWSQIKYIWKASDLMVLEIKSFEALLNRFKKKDIPELQWIFLKVGESWKYK